MKNFSIFLFIFFSFFCLSDEYEVLFEKALRDIKENCEKCFLETINSSFMLPDGRGEYFIIDVNNFIKDDDFHGFTNILIDKYYDFYPSGFLEFSYDYCFSDIVSNKRNYDYAWGKLREYRKNDPEIFHRSKECFLYLIDNGLFDRARVMEGYFSGFPWYADYLDFKKNIIKERVNALDRFLENFH